MTTLTLQKNVLIHRTISNTVTYNNLNSAIENESLVSVKCISAYAKRRFQKIIDMGFVIESIITPISFNNEMAFAEYILRRVRS